MPAAYRLAPKGVVRSCDAKPIQPHKSDPDWQEYCRWVREGGVADPYVPPPSPPPQPNQAEMARAREERIFRRNAKTDPVAALLRKAGVR